MVFFFDFMRILKGILYYFIKILKYLIFGALLVTLIGFILLIFSLSTKAETIIPSEVIAKSNEWNYNNCVIFEDGAGNLYIPKSTKYNNDFTTQQTGKWSIRKGNINGVSHVFFVNPVYYVMQLYRYDGNNTYTQVSMNDYNSNSRIDKDYLNRDLKVVYATQNVIYTSYSGKTNGDVYFSSTFINPEFLNAQDTNWGNSLITGDFNYFFIDGYSAGNGTVPLIFTVIDITMANQNNDLFTDSYTQQFELYPSSSYRYMVENDMYQYAIPKTDLKFGYKDENLYKFVLSWQSEGNTGTNNWNITTDFFADSTLTDEQKDRIRMIEGLNNIANETQNINNFLNDDTYNQNSIINNMPSSSNYTSPTDDGFNGIFSSFYNAFTNTDAQSVRFYFPNSNNQYIDIPPDLVTSKIPSAILFIIQSFYWFIICRFIIKDIAHTAEKAKSGEILDDQSDGNIKTDLL